LPPTRLARDLAPSWGLTFPPRTGLVPTVVQRSIVSTGRQSAAALRKQSVAVKPGVLRANDRSSGKNQAKHIPS
jgi:hypothetical protein